MLKRNIGMKTKMIVMVLAFFIAIFSGCSDEGTSKTSSPSDKEVLDFGWNNFVAGDYSAAKDNFNELITREALLADAHSGLGWSNTFLDLLQNAADEFNFALNTQPSDSLKNDIYAGLSFVYDALNYPQECISATDNVATNWQFAYKADLDFNDIILLRAINYYALGEFDNSLIEVQRLDQSFNTDVSTVEGRAALANKIEALKGS